MKIKINGQDYNGFTSATVSRKFTDASGKFSFNATPKTPGQDYPIQLGDECVITVEDQIFLTGYVESFQLDRQNAMDEFKYIFSGRDRTCDLIDSTIDWNIITDFSGDITLSDLCSKVISGLQIQNLGVVDNVNPATFSKDVLIAPEAGQNAFHFVGQYAKLAQTLLSTDGQGNLTIERTSTNQISTLLLLEYDGQNNNILGMSSGYTTTNQFNAYKAYSQMSLITFEFQSKQFQDGDEANAVGQIGTSTNSQIRTGRNYVFIGETPLSDAQTAQNYADWENNFRQAKAFSYQCRVAEHTYDGNNIWLPNTLVKVKDDAANIDAILLIDSVQFDEDLANGKTTTLNLVWKDSYSLLIEDNYRSALANVRQQEYTALDAS